MTDVLAVTDATWPAARRHAAGAFTVREGLGGGQRVSAATAEGDWTGADIDAAEARHRALGQVPLFLIRPGEDRLDEALATRGYAVKDPVNLIAAPVAAVAAEAPALMTFAIWPPLAIMNDLWDEGGIGAGRRDVMVRAGGPKTAVLGRIGDRAVGTAFVAVHDGTAMLHALTVSETARRRGLATHMMRTAAKWAQDHGAQRFSVLVTRDNLPANALYASLGMRIVGQYHYRIQRT